MERFDFVVLGGGTAGLVAATTVSAHAKRVALIDPWPIGGLCSLRGCNPKKIFVRAAAALQEAREARAVGVSVGDISVDWNKVVDRKEGFTNPVTRRAERALAEAGVTHIVARPRFAGEDRLNADGRTIAFDGALIATGSRPRELHFPGAAHVVTSDQLLELRHIPKTLAIIGGGVVAFEFAHVFCRIGCEVHLLVRGRRMLGEYDQDVVRRLVDHSAALNIHIHEATEVERIETQPSGLRLRLSTGKRLDADVVLNAAGRPANVQDLNLDAAQVMANERGVAVSPELRAPDNPRIFVAGDAHGKKQLTPVAAYEARVAVHNYLKADRKAAVLDGVPSVVFTLPPLAGVGMTEDEARAQGHTLEVLQDDLSAWTVPSIEHAGPVHAKVVIDKTDDRILGVFLFGARAEEMIHIAAAAVRFKLKRQDLVDMLYAYPTFSGMIKEVLRVT